MNVLLLAALVTSIVAGRPVPVVCDQIVDQQGMSRQGWYDESRGVIVLNPGVCAALTARTVRYRATAVFTLAHEAAHAKGIVNEREADCTALAALPLIVKRTKLPASIVQFAWATHRRASPPYSGPCP